MTEFRDMKEQENCGKMLKEWKNVSCIMNEIGSMKFLSKYRNPDGSAAMKVAEPPIVIMSNWYFRFKDGSPFAFGFLETMRRVQETGLIYRAALINKSNKQIVYVPENTEEASSGGIKSSQLLMILGIGLSISALVFILELVLDIIKKKKK